MMYEMRRKPEPTLLLTRGIFNLPNHTDMVLEELSFDNAIKYALWWKSRLAEVMV